MCGGTGVRLTTDEIVKGECEHDGGEGGDGLAVGASGTRVELTAETGWGVKAVTTGWW